MWRGDEGFPKQNILYKTLILSLLYSLYKEYNHFDNDILPPAFRVKAPSFIDAERLYVLHTQSKFLTNLTQWDWCS